MWLYSAEWGAVRLWGFGGQPGVCNLLISPYLVMVVHRSCLETTRGNDLERVEAKEDTGFPEVHVWLCRATFVSSTLIAPSFYFNPVHALNLFSIRAKVCGCALFLQSRLQSRRTCWHITSFNAKKLSGPKRRQ